MCRLVAISGDAPDTARLMLSNLLWLDASQGNKDGTGVWSKEGIYKTGNEAGSVVYTEEFNEWCSNMSLPFIGHVRAISKGKTGDAGAHPFQVGNIVLAHNGTFRGYDDKVKELGLESDLVDSHVITHWLESIYSETEDMLESIKTLLEEVEGSYAMLIAEHDTPEVIWAVRGSNTLNWQRVGDLLVVNTTSKPLQVATRLTAGSLQLLGNGRPELGENGEFAHGTVHRIESGKAEKVHSFQPKAYTTTSYAYSGYSRKDKKGAEEKEERVEQVARLLVANVPVEELSIAAGELYGDYFSEISVENLKSLVDTLIEIYQENQEKRGKWVKVFEWCFDPYHLIGKETDIKFPGVLHTEEELNEIVNSVIKEVREGVQ
jgi:predicted glutamine amidotransferase